VNELKTLPNHHKTVATVQTHTLDLPQCCPISGNPQPGSTIEISYTPQSKHIEVYSLRDYISTYIGGKKCPYSGTMIEREMESMIQRIAIDCAAAASVPVSVVAHLVLDCGRLRVECEGRP
jgi:hypothetical protein